MRIQKLYLILLISVMSFNFMGCNPDSPVKKWFDKLFNDKGVEQNLNDALDNATNALEDANDALEDATDALDDTFKDTTQKGLKKIEDKASELSQD